MDRILSITLAILLISAGLSYVQGWGIFNIATTVPGAAQAITPNIIAQGAGCGSSSSPNCPTTPSLSYTGTSYFGNVLFIGDWLGALAAFVGTFSTIVPVPGQLITAYAGPSAAPLAGIVDIACWFDYFLFVILFLRGGKP